jgi:hypothetical protein
MPFCYNIRSFVSKMVSIRRSKALAKNKTCKIATREERRA